MDPLPQGRAAGNPAAVCPLVKWLPEAVMQNLAAENNLSETVFFVKEKGRISNKEYQEVLGVARMTAIKD